MCKARGSTAASLQILLRNIQFNGSPGQGSVNRKELKLTSAKANEDNITNNSDTNGSATDIL